MTKVKELKDKDVAKKAIRSYLSEDIDDLIFKVLVDINDCPKDDLSDATKMLIARRKLENLIADIDTVDDDVAEAICSFIFLEHCKNKYSDKLDKS